MQISEPISDVFYDEKYYHDHYPSMFNDEYYKKISDFWKYVIFDDNGIIPAGKILDFGAGLGQVTASVGADCFDPSLYARNFLQEKQRKVLHSTQEIPRAYYDLVLSSHALEHAINPNTEIQRFKSYLTKGGGIVLLLPLEKTPGSPVYAYDDNKHFYCWNFQTITNLLLESGFKIEKQRVIFGPFGLSKLNHIPLAAKLGRMKKNFPSLLTFARKES
jgi:SAM-dependent methyltransferase